MSSERLFSVDRVSDNLLANLDSRDVALWIRSLPEDLPSRDKFVSFLGLPWRLVLIEDYDRELIEALEATASLSDPMIRRRGYAQVIDSDPSRIELPQRCLPILLLNGPQPDVAVSDFQRRLIRMTMLEELRRSGARALLVISDADEPVPDDLVEIWSSAFRPDLTVVSGADNATDSVEKWLQEIGDQQTANLVSLSAAKVIDDILSRYEATYPEDRIVVRVRDRSGAYLPIDVTELDEPERPILDRYSLVQERDLTQLTPDDLSQNELVAFFENPEGSWRPYAAGLPWIRDPSCIEALKGHLERLDSAGPEGDSVVYIASEPGAGGTTLARILAWHLARQGYPALVAKSVPFVPDALPIVNFLNRFMDAVNHESPNPEGTRAELQDGGGRLDSRRYEPPWLLVFDTLHWEGRDSELVRFRNELERSGRKVCILLVTGTALAPAFLNARIFHELTVLNHAIDKATALDLGHHLNVYLRVYGKEREDLQWELFHEDHTVRFLEGQAAFWVSLSFWIRGQYNLDESIQEWMFRSFKENATDETLRDAVLEIAALSSERLPLPEPLLPESSGRWPTAQLLEDSLSSMAALGLVRISDGTDRHWGLIHDILGRFLINALFYDFQLRADLGFAEARDAEHLRFLLLRRISRKALLSERAFRSLGEDFATSVFKIDPDRGRGSFAAIWSEVLAALDEMPRPLRDASRVFRHHTAISRRRIAKLDATYYGVTDEAKLDLLNRAIEDIKYALTFIDYEPGSESNLNLYNSLANAYFDLADLEMERGAPRERILELRGLASESTRNAYDESPTNSFVIETYVKNLLQSARISPDEAIQQCIDALGILFSAITANEAAYRASHLGELADRALEILFAHYAPTAPPAEPGGPIDVLLQAWSALIDGAEDRVRLDLSEFPTENIERALGVLTHPVGRGNMQVLRMTYDLLSRVRPYAFKEQIELVDQLDATDYRLTPQLRLEHAVLLYQNDRSLEGDKAFRRLRQLWRDSEHFVRVPERLRWLRTPDGAALQTVQAIAASDYGNRAMARVKELGDSLVPFRPEEHSIRDLRPGMRFACKVSFGHNGALLRPVTTVAAGRVGAEVG